MSEVKKKNHRHLLGLLITGIGVILFWRGIWEISAKYFSEEISLILGLGILIGVALAERRQVFKFFGGGGG